MNNLTQYPVPEWISIAFVFAITLPFILILHFIKKEENKISKNSIFRKATLFCVFYIAYVILASYLGWFDAVSLPPRVLLLTTFPFAFLLFVVVAKTKAFNTIVESASLDSLVQLHLFRLVGVFFVLLALHDALPKPFAMIAGIGDMLTAISSIFVAKALRDKKTYAVTLAYYWNIFGTVDILFTAIAANVLTKISMDTGVMGVDTLAMFPFCLIPAFAPPTILFIHWIIFKKIKEISA